METFVGIFASSAAALRAARLVASDSGPEIATLIPATRENSREVLALAADVTSTGTGSTIMVKAPIPEIGPVIGQGNRDGALLQSLVTSSGHPIDVDVDPDSHPGRPAYELALRRGCSVLVVQAEGQEDGKTLRGLMEQEGAESIDLLDAEGRTVAAKR